MKSIVKLGRLGLPVALVLVAGACHVINDTGRVTNHSLQPFESCDSALAQLQYAAKENLAQQEANTDDRLSGSEPNASDTAEKAAPTSQPQHSETNVQVEGVDEPDIVKTNGDRIVTIADEKLVIVDTETRKQAHQLNLPIADSDSDNYYGGAYEPQLLIHEDRALVISQSHTDKPVNSRFAPAANAQSKLVLIDLSDEPKIVNTYEFEGAFVDARAVNQTTRLVMRSSPQFETSDPDTMRDAIDNSVIDDWLPQYRVNGETGHVDCGDLIRPADYSGTSTLTILTFDLNSALDDGDPLAIEADGQTVYATKTALYVANDRHEFVAEPMWGGGQSHQPTTEIYRFDIAGTDTPTHESSGEVPGFLLNQYSMSEFEGHLRVATTHSSVGAGEDSQSSNSLYVLSIGESTMKRVGEVNDLGIGERIFAVRFMGDKGYVVTFRQTDPLYSFDLSDPQNPQRTGELKITGYSAYLHPVLEGRLIGVGQEADTNGSRQGLQVSLFDVSNDEVPTRVDQYHVPGETSNVEFEPHAFLYFEPESLLAVPTYGDSAGVRLLHVEADTITEETMIEHSEASNKVGIERTLVANNMLWSLSADMLMAHSLDDYAKEAQVDL